MQKGQIFQLLRRFFLQMKVCLRSGSRAPRPRGGGQKFRIAPPAALCLADPCATIRADVLVMPSRKRQPSSNADKASFGTIDAIDLRA